MLLALTGVGHSVFLLRSYPAIVSPQPLRGKINNATGELHPRGIASLIPGLFPATPPGLIHGYRLPMNSRTMLSKTSERSMAFDLRLCSWKMRAPKRKLTTTLPRRIIDTIEIIACGSLSA